MELFRGKISLKNIEVEGITTTHPPFATIDKVSLKFDTSSLLRGKDFFQSIRKVEINKVNFSLFIDEKGHLNLPRPKPAKLPKRVFTFPLEIGAIDGNLQDDFVSKQKWRIKGRGKIIIHQGATYFLIQGGVNGSPFLIRGEYQQERVSLGLALKSLKFSLPQASGVVSAGLLLQVKGGKLLWEAQAILQNASITQKKLPFKILNCSLDFLGNQDTCWIRRLKLSIDKGVSFNEGELLFSLHKPYTLEAGGVFEGKASSFLSLFDVSKKGKDSQLMGDFPLRVELKAVGNLSRPILEANVQVAKAYFRGLAIDNNKVSIRYFNDNLEIVQGEGQLMGGEIGYRGIIKISDKIYVFRVMAKNIDFQRLPDNIKQEMKRTLKLKEFPEGKLKNAVFLAKGIGKESPYLELQTQLSQFKYLKVLGKNLYIKMDYKDDVVDIERLSAEDEKGSFAFIGKVNLTEQTIDGDIEGMDINIGKIAQLFGVGNCNGYAYLRGRVNGALREPRFECGVEAFDLGYGAYEVDHFSCQLEREGAMLRISELSFVKGMGEGEAKGEANILTGGVSLEGKVNNLLLSELLPEDIVKTGVGEGNFLIKGSLHSLDFEFEGKATDLLIKDNYLKTIDMALAWENGKGKVRKGKAVLEEGEVDFKGEFDKNELLLSLEGHNISLAQLPFLEEEIEGYVGFKGQVEGTLTSPRFQGEVFGDVIYSGEKGRLLAKISIDKSRVEGKEISYSIKDGKLSAALSYSLKEGNLTGYLQADNLPLTLVERLSHIPTGWGGKLSTNLTISGNRKEPYVRGMFRCDELGNRYLELTHLEGNYTLDEKILRLQAVRGEKGDFTLDGQAEFDILSKDYSLSFEAKNLPLAMLKSFMPQLKPEGKGYATIKSSGNFSLPFLSLAFNSPEAKLNGVELENLKLLAEWDGKVLTLKDVALWREGKEVKGEARLPFGWKDGLRKDKPWYVMFGWEKQDISWLKNLTPSLDVLEGNATGSVTVRGTYDEPDASGYIVLEKCNLKPKGFGEGLKNTNAKLVLQKNRASFENVSFQVGEGRGEIKGNLYMGREGIKIETVASLMNATLETRNFSGYGENFKGSLNGFLNITGDIGKPLLLGSLSLSNAKLDLSSYTPLKEGRQITLKKGFNPTFLLTLGLGSNCWFASAGSRVLAEGRLSLIGSLSSPRFQGHFSSRSGILLISNYIFRLREGAVDVVYVGNVLSLNVFARAETKLREYKITAYITGPYDNLQLRFTSSPPLPQNAILAMFVPEEFAGNPEQFLKKELTSAFATGLEARVLAPLEFALAEKTGLEEIGLEYGLEGYPILKLKQSILPKTYLVYSRWLTTPQERYTLALERNIGGDIYLTFTTDELKRKIWGIEGAMRF